MPFRCNILKPEKTSFLGLAALCIFIGGDANRITGPVGTPVDFTMIDSGSYADLESPAGSYVFTNRPGFENFFHKLLCTVRTPCTPPEIDFESLAVIAVIMWSKPSRGYSIKVG